MTVTTHFASDGWSIEAQQGPISSSAEISEVQNALGFHMPDMLYGRNLLTVSNGTCSIKFSARGALAAVAIADSNDALPQVDYADEWKSTR